MAEAGTPADCVWLVVADADGVERDVGVEVPGAVAGAELLATLAAHVGSDPSGLALYSTRLRSRVDEIDDVAPLLQMGDRLRLHDVAIPPPWPADPGRAAVVDLVVVGGPLQGTRIPLGHGEHLVGRGSGSDIKLDDLAMSRLHLRILVSDTGIAVEDVGSTNGTFVAGERLSEERELSHDEVVEAGSSLLSFRPHAPSAGAQPERSGATIGFNRPPRVQLQSPDLAVSLPAPPEDPTGRRLPLAASVIPLAVGVALVVLLPFNPAMLLFFAVTPMMATWSVVAERRTGRKAFERNANEFRARVEEARERLERDVVREIAIRREGAPDAATIAAMARERSPRLWERRPSDTDFLALRVGYGDEPSGLRTDVGARGSAALRQEAERAFAGCDTLASVPAQLSLPVCGTIGLAGGAADVAALTRWLTIQIAALHSPRDVVLAAALPDTAVGGCGWFKWLPHATVEVPHLPARIAFGRSGTADLILRMRALIEERRSAAGRSLPAAVPPRPAVVLIVDHAAEAPAVETSEVLARGPEVGVFTLWAGEDPHLLPGECGAVVRVDVSSDVLDISVPSAGTMMHRNGPEGLDPNLTRDIALLLAPVRDVTHRAASAAVPDRLPLFDALEIDRPTGAMIGRRWRSSGPSLEARVGSSASGPFAIDLRADGPHCLIGGTTGAGKSELLQTLVASLAASFPPDRVNLILIDYKGGTAFKDCVRLPHAVGFVTDLDRGLARRALASLEAELRRRERILRSAGARDLLEMERSAPSDAPPALLIVIDEFAALARELPEFVEGVVDVAQRGRGLGIHLVLATQRPAGVVTDTIRANTNLRIALRVADEPDSVDVVGVSDAARIPRSLPGRAFARTGHSEVVEFQAAFAGAPPRAGRSAEIRVFDLTPAGTWDGDLASRPAPSPEGETELQVLVDEIAGAHASSGHPPPFEPWRPPLPDVVALDEVASSGDPERGRVAIGIFDEPEAQRQDAYVLDLESASPVLIYGGGGSGKTTLLRTIAAAIAAGSSPEEVAIYGLDFGTRGLQPIEALPHCGSVVPGDDAERVRRLFSMLGREIGRRRDTFAAAGSTSLLEYRRTGLTVPRIVVLLDGYAAFAGAFERVDFGELIDVLPRLAADGRQLGIDLVVSAERRGTVPGALSGVSGARIVLRLADEDEYSALGLDPRAVRGTHMPPGRGFADGRLAIQCAVCSTDPSGAAQAEALARIADDARGAHPNVQASPVRLLSDHVSRSEMARGTTALQAAIGWTEDLAPAIVDLTNGHFVVAGSYRSGRTTALETIADGLKRSSPETEIHLMAVRGGPVAASDMFATVASGVEECGEATRRVAEIALARKLDPTGPPIVVIVDDGDELADSTESYALEQAVRAGRSGYVRFVVGAESSALHRSFGGFLSEIRKDKQGLLLMPEVEIDGDLLGVRLPRRSTSAFPPGRGFLVTRGAVDLIQVAS